MPTKLTSSSDHAVEGSTIAITAAFTDENGDAVAPDTLTYTLTDEDGNIIDSLEDENVASPSSSETIVLSGSNLGITAAEKAATSETFVLRIFTVEATFTSDLGSGLPLRDQLTFAVDITTVDHDGA